MVIASFGILFIIYKHVFTCKDVVTESYGRARKQDYVKVKIWIYGTKIHRCI